MKIEHNNLKYEWYEEELDLLIPAAYIEDLEEMRDELRNITIYLNAYIRAIKIERSQQEREKGESNE